MVRYIYIWYYMILYITMFIWFCLYDYVYMIMFIWLCLYDCLCKWALSDLCRTTQILYCIVFITRCSARTIVCATEVMTCWRIGFPVLLQILDFLGWLEIARYLDLLDHAQSFYLVFFKLTWALVVFLVTVSFSVCLSATSGTSLRRSLFLPSFTTMTARMPGGSCMGSTRSDQTCALNECVNVKRLLMGETAFSTYRDGGASSVSASVCPCSCGISYEWCWQRTATKSNTRSPSGEPHPPPFCPD